MMELPDQQGFEQWAASRGHDTRIYGDGNYADEVIDLAVAWSAGFRAGMERAAKIADERAKMWAQIPQCDQEVAENENVAAAIRKELE